MFCKDTRTENFLTQMGVEFKYTNGISISSLCPNWETKNLARPVSKREDAICEYASLMESGSVAPAPILHECSTGYEVLDGVQRLFAAKILCATTICAYVVSCDSEKIIACIRVLANARLQGRPEPPEWTKRRAVEILVLQQKMSVQEVARMGGWKLSDVESLANAMEFGFQLRCIGGPVLPDTVINCISKYVSVEDIKKAPAPISKFCEMIKSLQISAADAEPYIEEFFKPTTKNAHEIYLERLDEFTSNPEIETRIAGRKSQPIPRDVCLRRTLKSAATILKSIVDDGDELLYIDEFFRLTKQINDQLHGLSKAHKKRVSARVPADMYRTCDE